MKTRLILSLLLTSLLVLPCFGEGDAVPTYRDIEGPPHFYKTKTPKDRFTRTMETLEKDPRLDRSSELAFLTSFLKILEVPVSSQTLVFSATSLQLRFISPSNPRAIYFSEDTYVGYIPGGRLEIVSLDPELGAIFHIFDIPRGREPVRAERSHRCLNCHASDDTGYTPGLVIESVVPASNGASLDRFRDLQSGHGVALKERFGGWYVTGDHSIRNHWGNTIGEFVKGEIERRPNPPGTRFSWAKYPVPTSDMLPHLLHEHQAGFVNRVVEAGYRARTIQYLSPENRTPEQEAELDEQAGIIVRYLLFADEVVLPGVEPDGDYRQAFLANRRMTTDGRSLKDLDLTTRLFKHRCTYMIYSPVFTGLPDLLKSRIFARLDAALKEEGGDPDFDYLPAAEKRAIRQILRATLDGLPAGW